MKSILKDKQNKPTQIGEVAHDLDDPMQNQNLRKLSQKRWVRL